MTCPTGNAANLLKALAANSFSTFLTTGLPSNLIYGTNPNVANANPLQTQNSNGRLGLTFPRNTAITDVVAKVQGADALTGPWTDLAQSTGGASFVSLANGATVSETGTGAVLTVSFSDAYLLTDPAHPS